MIGQICLTISYQLSRASYVAPYSYFYVLFSGMLGFGIWSEFPDIISIFGYCLIIISYLFLIQLQKKEN